MKSTVTGFLLLVFALSAFSGCRREDIREVTVEIPSLTESNRAGVREAFVIRDKRDPRRNRYYDGIFADSIKTDAEKKTVTLTYDSMKIAHTNIRMLLAAAGYEVVFPENRNGTAR